MGKELFDKHHDGHGFIDKDKFIDMLNSMLRTKACGDLPTDRIQNLWREIDQYGIGKANFFDFANWFVKCFDQDIIDENGSCCLIEAFYASYNPIRQRRRSTTCSSKLWDLVRSRLRRLQPKALHKS